MPSRGDRSFVRPSQLVWKLSDVARQFRERQVLSPQSALGRRGEDLAHRYLKGAGFTVLARNYRPGNGEAEADIVARQGDKLVFIEVKSRSTDEFGSPDRAIGEQKRRNMLLAAKSYVARSGASWEQVRFDAISIVFAEPPKLHHQQDIFSGHQIS